MPRSRSPLLAALVAVAGLGLLLVMVVVVGREERAATAEGGLGDGFHALSADEFSAAILEAQRDAGSWRYEEVETLDGTVRATWVGEQVWDGTTSRLRWGAQDGAGEYLIEVLLVDGEIFVKDTRTTGAAARRPWLRLRARGNAQSQALVESLQREADPARRAAVFEDPASFELLGVENIGSDVAAHYRVAVPVERVRDASGLPVPGEPGDQQVFDVWLDRQDRLVRIVIPASVGGVESVETRTFSDYGADLGIEAPPADQVRNGRPVLAG